MIEGIDILPDDFIVYEMLIRQQPLARSTLASRKRKFLRIFQTEQETGQVSPMVFHLRLEDDLAQCEILLTNIITAMDANLNASAEKCEIQLIFLKERVERLPPSPNLELTQRRLTLINRIEDLEKQFGNVTVPTGLGENAPMSTDPIENHVVQLETFDRPEAHSIQASRLGANSTSVGPNRTGERQNVLPTNRQFNCENNRRNGLVDQPMNNTSAMAQASARPNTQTSTNNSLSPNTNILLHPAYESHAQMWKWNLKFSGERDDMLASVFIQKVKDYAMSREVSQAEIMNGMPELLTGAAANWFRTTVHSKPFSSFSDFAVRFLEDFEPYYKVDTRLEMLKKRLQRQNERIVTFFAHVENEFLTMSFTPSKEEQIRIVRRLLLPHFITHLAFQTFTDLTELKDACKKIELSYKIVKSQGGAHVQENSNPSKPYVNVDPTNQFTNTDPYPLNLSNPSRPQGAYGNRNNNVNNYESNMNRNQRSSNPTWNQQLISNPTHFVSNNVRPSAPNNAYNQPHPRNFNGQPPPRYPLQPDQFQTIPFPPQTYLPSNPPPTQPTQPQKQLPNQNYPPKNQQHVRFQNNNENPSNYSQQLQSNNSGSNVQKGHSNNRYSSGYQNFYQGMNGGPNPNRTQVPLNTSPQTTGRENTSKVACLAEAETQAMQLNISDQIHESLMNLNFGAENQSLMDSSIDLTLNSTPEGDGATGGEEIAEN